MRKIFISLILLLFAGLRLFSQGSVSTDGSQPEPSAMLDVKSANKGILPPRVELEAMNLSNPVAFPATGLLVYNTIAAGIPPNNVLPGYYRWNSTKWIPVSLPQGVSASDMPYWNGTQWVLAQAGSNGQMLTVINGVPAWGQSAFICGTPLTISHVAGEVSPVSKTVTYGTVKNIPGEPAKCWIASNLGADHHPTAPDDATEASAGWYWQFNRKQGYSHDGSSRTPNTTWISTVNESSDWLPANDPCALELGTGWRIPTYTEWDNVDTGGGWANPDGPFYSGLKLHAAGALNSITGSLFNRGIEGHYWSSTKMYSTTGLYLLIQPAGCVTSAQPKATGTSVRCVRSW